MENKDNGRSVAGQKSSEGGRGDPNKASPAAVERYIKGIDFPASKEELISKAKTNGAPQEVLNLMKHFEAKEYKALTDISKEAGRVG